MKVLQAKTLITWSSTAFLRQNSASAIHAIPQKKGEFTPKIDRNEKIPTFPNLENQRIISPLNINNESRDGTGFGLLKRKSPDLISIRRRNFSRSIDPKTLNSVSLLEIKKFLRMKCLDFRESHACLRISVPKHLLRNPSNPPPSSWKGVDQSLADIFVNKTTGAFVCPDAALNGDWKDLSGFLEIWTRNKSTKKGEKTDPYPILPEINLNPDGEMLDFYQKCLPIESISAQEFRDLLKRLKLPVRELKMEDFVRFEVKVNPEKTQLVFPVRYYARKNPIIGLRIVKLCEETSNLTEENFASKADDNKIFPLPHGLDRARLSGNRSVVLVSSVLDSVALTAGNNRNLAVVALASGISHLPPDHLAFLEDFDRVDLWFPNDVTSFESVRAFAKKLGEKRCHVVGGGRETPNPLIYLLRKKDPQAMSMAEMLKSNTRPFSHDFITTFESLREDVFLEMAHFEEVEGIKWKRFEGLNETLRGFRRGELSVFTGKTGSGKTTFMSEYSLDLCMQGVNTLWGSFEVKNVRLAKMQMKQFSAVNLEDNLDSFDFWADRFQKLPMYYLTFHGAQEVDKVLDAMGHAVYIYDIAHVIIDNIQFMMGMSGRIVDRFHLQDIMIQKFRKFATLHNVHVTLVIHPRKEDDERLTANSIFGGAKATQEADNVVILQEEDLNVKVKRKYVQVVKNRFAGDLGVVPLFFTKGTLTFSKKIFTKEKNLARKKRESPKIESVGEELQPPRETLIEPDTRGSS